MDYDILVGGGYFFVSQQGMPRREYDYIYDFFSHDAYIRHNERIQVEGLKMHHVLTILSHSSLHDAFLCLHMSMNPLME